MKARTAFAPTGVALVALFSLTACGSGPVDLGVGPTNVSEPCGELLGRLPVVVADQRIRALSPERLDAAAWGEPPIVVICDIDEPADLTATSSLIEIEGVTWFPQELEGGTAFTSVGRTSNIQVRVPRTYAPEASVIVELSPYVREALPASN